MHLNLIPQNWFLCFLPLIGVLAGWGTHQNRGKLHKNSQKTVFGIATIFFTFQPGHFFDVKTCYLSPNCKECLDFEVRPLKALEQRILKLVLVLIGVQKNRLSGLGKV